MWATLFKPCCVKQNSSTVAISYDLYGFSMPILNSHYIQVICMITANSWLLSEIFSALPCLNWVLIHGIFVWGNLDGIRSSDSLRYWCWLCEKHQSILSITTSIWCHSLGNNWSIWSWKMGVCYWFYENDGNGNCLSIVVKHRCIYTQINNDDKKHSGTLHLILLSICTHDDIIEVLCFIYSSILLFLWKCANHN